MPEQITDISAWLKENYHKKTRSYCVQKLGITSNAVYQRAKRLHLTEQPQPVWDKDSNGLIIPKRKRIMETKPLNLEEKIPVRIDRRTVVYANPNDRIQDILKKYKPLSCN